MAICEIHPVHINQSLGLDNNDDDAPSERGISS